MRPKVYNIKLRATVEIEPGGAVFQPTDVGGCVLWVKADAITGLSDGDPVGTWADQSGNGNDLVQATAAKKPTYETNECNGEPIVRFDSVDDYLKAVAFTWNRPEVVYIVFKSTAWLANHTLFDGDSANAMRCLQYTSDPRHLSYHGDATWASYYIDCATHSWVIARFRFEAGSKGIRKNDSAEVAGDGGSTDASGFTLGAMANGTNSGKWDIAEVIGYNAVPSSGSDTDIMDYLNTKYAVY